MPESELVTASFASLTLGDYSLLLVTLRENPLAFLIRECEPHLPLGAQRFHRVPRVLISSAFTGYRLERRAVAQAATLCQVSVVLMEHFKGANADAFEWTKNETNKADVVVVLLGLRQGSHPFGQASLLAPYTYFGTELKFAMHSEASILTYYVGRSRDWDDWRFLAENDEERRAAESEPISTPGSGIVLGGFAANLTSWWLREPSSAEELLRWTTSDLTEALWARTRPGRLFWLALRPFRARPPGTLRKKRPIPLQRWLLRVLTPFLCVLWRRPQLAPVYLMREGEGFGLKPINAAMDPGR